jgi:UDP-N-acetylmuramate dehydrogenase
MISKNVALKGYTSWQVGGAADYFCLPKNIEEIKEAQEFAAEKKISMQILGAGSNVLISDQGIDGLVICMRDFKKYEVSEGERLQIVCEAGMAKSEVLKIFLKHRLAPALFLAGIPGDVGGGIVMNAGVGENFLPREFVEVTDWIEVLKKDGSIQRYEKNDLQWSYRHCHGWQPGIIVKASLSWPMKPDDSILVQVKEANRLRLSRQPLHLPSCGSVFINPPEDKAARLIDSCGLKGYTVGEAQVSMKHANFIVNLGAAKAKDILAVIRHVQAVVKKNTGVGLTTEVVMLGFRDELD